MILSNRKYNTVKMLEAEITIVIAIPFIDEIQLNITGIIADNEIEITDK